MSDENYGLRQEVEEFEKNVIATFKIIVGFIDPSGGLLQIVNDQVKKYNSSAGFLE